MGFPFLVPEQPDSTPRTGIVPAFPNWERSFVSGTKSPLFQVAHFITEGDSGVLITNVDFKQISEGPPGHVHGGASAALLDEIMGVMVWHRKFYCVTQTLNVHYGRALPLDKPAIVYTEIKAVHERTVEVHSTIYTQGVAMVSSQGIFHRLSEKQLERFKK